MPLISIVYKYNSQKVISFIATEVSERVNYGITYLSNYPDLFDNVPIFPVSIPLVVPNLSGSSNEVDSHNKFRQYDLVLENYLVTQFVWIQLFTAVYMVVIIKNYGNYFILGIREIIMKN